MMANKEPIALKADPADLEDFDVSAAAVKQALADRAQRRARGLQKAETKQAVSIRLDADVVARLRATGKGWQSRVNDILRREILNS